MQRLEFCGCDADPVAQCRAIDDEPIACEDLRLPIERHMVGVFRHDHIGDERFGRDAAFDQARRRRRLDHTSDSVGARLLAMPAGVFQPPRYEHAQLRRNLVEPLGALFADLMQLAATARARLRIWLDDDLLARQMRRQMAAIGTVSLDCLTLDDGIGGLSLGVLDREADLHILKREIELVFADLLGRAAKVRAAQDAENVSQALVLCLEAKVLACSVELTEPSCSLWVRARQANRPVAKTIYQDT